MEQNILVYYTLHTAWSINPTENPWGVLYRRLYIYMYKTLYSSLIPSSVQDFGEKLKQLSTEINVVTLHKLIETILWQMRVVIKAKCGRRNIRVRDCFFDQAVYNILI